jgi:curved DNA-binding protein CbpA
MNPYVILRVTPQSTDTEIRRAYLEAIREFPPERAPEQFQKIAHAYEQIRDEDARLNYRLFDRTPGGSHPGEALAAYCVAAPPPEPLDFQSLKEFLRSCAKT